MPKQSLDSFYVCSCGYGERHCNVSQGPAFSNAKYKFICQELPFNGWVLNPTDLQTLELLREDGTTGPFRFKNVGNFPR